MLALVLEILVVLLSGKRRDNMPFAVSETCAAKALAPKQLTRLSEPRQVIGRGDPDLSECHSVQRRDRCTAR